MAPEVYEFLEWASPFLIVWSACFTLIHSVRIARRFRKRLDKFGDNAAGFYAHGMPAMMFAFIVWIINDQYEKAFFQRPNDPSLLRNMVYFPKLRVGDAEPLR